jgi:hypothetical protein
MTSFCQLDASEPLIKLIERLEVFHHREDGFPAYIKECNHFAYRMVQTPNKSRI